MISQVDLDEKTMTITEKRTINGAEDYLNKYEATYLDYDTSFYLFNDTLKVENNKDKVKVTLFVDDEQIINDIIYNKNEELKNAIEFFESEFEDIFTKIEQRFIGRENGVDIYE